MDVIPAIDLLAGQCVRLYQGDYAQSEVFSSEPATVAQQWVSQGAARLHVVDLDGAKQGEAANLAAIAAIVAAVDVPVQVGGGVRDRQSLQMLFDLGVERAIIGTLAVEQPESAVSWCQEFPGKVAIGIDARNGQVATHGWQETSTVRATDLAQRFAASGAAAIVYTDIQRDGTLQGPNLSALRELASSVTLPVIASGGVSSLTDLLSLLALAPLGVSGVIVGKALYTGRLSLTEALQAIGPGRWQDVPPGSSTLA
ncbi:MAG: 1-(5-phosphoribosyl)-5-[(5-phosphoribosylamino)methylideneamino]imidazole-4-carboxamide isomerase [Spirulinaceae cyanobacterium RM2_2_10]|nr:1-(5-phosphoribosyl)-5-[(5-phosphoribosylamino)methylideneamino]imidazole-4-carboxamide isomerase [Spirulinaceae cyanobacterium SM2_1_0]NJO21049.1 1-(5-phosphoribosyl)-5-[(5-phosphoribosylamino)methylideneamino]imidazole-4-carboxamide isomerase [Spirulinaceae cyanobacterium RM2_2_10]